MDSYKPIPWSHVEDIACDMRHDILTMVHNCGKQNGHLGGCMSAVEVLAVLYSQIMNINEVAHSGRDWADRDRFIMSKGHAGIAMYAAMKHVGLVSQAMIDGDIRGENTVLFRHPKRNIEFGIECSVGSLGMGIGYGIGLAESFRRRNSGQKVFVMLGDGECNEGSVWEGAAYASHRGLENLTVIIDQNGLQLDGTTREVLAMDNMAERWKAFGFCVVEVDGHNIEAVYSALKTAHQGKPLAVIAHTIKGKGISFAENRVEWHDHYLSNELYVQGKQDLGIRELGEVRKLASERFESRRIHITENPKATGVRLSDTGEQIDFWHFLGSRNVIGEVSFQLAEQDELFTLMYSDCAKRIGIQKLWDKHPEKCYEAGIAEQNQISMAAAMAHEGFHVFAVAYAPFITARVLDQIRVNLGYMQAPVCLIGLAAGFAGSDLGATHTAFEDIANIRCIPNMSVHTPSDTYEIAKGMEYFCSSPASMYLRITIGNGDPMIYHIPGKYNAGQWDCLKRDGDIAIVGCGAVMKEILDASMELAAQGIEAAVYNARTIKPLGEIKQLKAYNTVFTVEEHNIIGGLGSALAEEFAGDKEYPEIHRIGIRDCYFAADTADRLKMQIGLTGRGIVTEIKQYLDGRC